MSIRSIIGSYVYDSRGNPTIEVNLNCDHGTFRASVPSGASTGVHEALVLRNKDNFEWDGKGVTRATRAINEVIAPQLIKSGLDVTDQAGIDHLTIELNGTVNQASLGANAIVGVSIAIGRAGAAKEQIPLYQHIA